MAGIPPHAHLPLHTWVWDRRSYFSFKAEGDRNVSIWKIKLYTWNLTLKQLGHFLNSILSSNFVHFRCIFFCLKLVKCNWSLISTVDTDGLLLWRYKEPWHPWKWDGSSSLGSPRSQKGYRIQVRRVSLCWWFAIRNFHNLFQPRVSALCQNTKHIMASMSDDACIRTGPSLIQVMACHLCSAKPSDKAITYTNVD